MLAEGGHRGPEHLIKEGPHTSMRPADLDQVTQQGSRLVRVLLHHINVARRL